MKKILTLSLCLLSLASCGDKDGEMPEWNWDSPSSTIPTEDKPRIVWIDAGGNFEHFANSLDNIRADLRRVKDAGFTEIVVDVRPTNGDVLFKTTVADPVTRLDVWTSNGYEWFERTATWDYLQAFIDEGHRLGLKVNASINTFVGGYACPYGLGNDGMLYRDSSRKSWATVLNTSGGLVNVTDLIGDENCGARFLNPANDDVQRFILSLLGELATYDIDGIILDRCRYDDHDMMSDFSAESQVKFEKFINRSIERFPNDILAPGCESLPSSSTPTLRRWLSFRAKTIHDFIVSARKQVKSINPDIRFGAYVGAWYSTYFNSGVNWASPTFDPTTLTSYRGRIDSDYRDYGYADHLDMLLVGAYASADNIYGSGEWTMQGFALQAGRLLDGATHYYCGPDIGNPTGWADGNQQRRIPDAIRACRDNSDGMFIFDLCHIRSFNYWDAFSTTLNNK